MAEYIERSKAKDELLSWAVCINHPEHLMKEDAMCVLDDIPAADVAPVVRCRDCKHYHEFDLYFDCNHNGGMDSVKPTDFCSYGERRGDG